MSPLYRFLSAGYCAAVLALMPAAALSNENAATNGEAIAREADRRDQGFVDSLADVEMVLSDEAGNEARRYLTIKTFESTTEDEGHKSLVVFHRPLDVKGTALLTHAEIFDADQQWLYLPTIKRVKRISSSNKTGPFMGSEFSYEDMLPPEVERYAHVYLATVQCGALECYKLERTPKDDDSGYKRQTAYLDTQEYRLQRVDYFNRRDELFKTLFFTDYKRYDDTFWRASRMTMVNHRSGKTTYLLWGDFSFKNGFSAADFSRTAMKN